MKHWSEMDSSLMLCDLKKQPPEVFHKTFDKIHRKTSVLEFRFPLFWKEDPTQVFSFEYCKILRNTYFEEHRRTAASHVILIELQEDPVKHLRWSFLGKILRAKSHLLLTSSWMSKSVLPTLSHSETLTLSLSLLLKELCSVL